MKTEKIYPEFHNAIKYNLSPRYFDVFDDKP